MFNQEKSFYQLSQRYQNYCTKLKGPILILGAGGFVGFNLLNSILLYRTDVFAVSSDPKNNWRFESLKIPKKNILKADLLKKNEIKKLILKIKPQTIFNLAAYGAYPSQNSIEKIYQTNFLASVQLIELLKMNGFSAYVYAGSNSEYGLNCRAPKENSELLPNSHYAVSKISAYYLEKYYALIENLPLAHLRLYSVYGPWEESSRLIPSLIYQALKKKYPPLVNPKISRDFIYTTDICEAFITSAYKINQVKGEVFNIGTGKKTTIKDLALKVKKIFKIKKDPFFGKMPQRQWDLTDWYSNSQKAEKNLKWQAKVTLDQGLKKTFIWYKNHYQKLKFSV